MNWKMRYKVTADWLPFREWVVMAESESEARLEVARKLGIPYEQTEAAIHND